MKRDTIILRRTQLTNGARGILGALSDDQRTSIVNFIQQSGPQPFAPSYLATEELVEFAE